MFGRLYHKKLKSVALCLGLNCWYISRKQSMPSRLSRVVIPVIKRKRLLLGLCLLSCKITNGDMVLVNNILMRRPMGISCLWGDQMSTKSVLLMLMLMVRQNRSSRMCSIGLSMSLSLCFLLIMGWLVNVGNICGSYAKLGKSL